MVEDSISSLDKGKIKYFQQVAQGEEKASIEGQDVIRYLKRAVLRQMPISEG
jgi:hypothetical protein